LYLKNSSTDTRGHVVTEFDEPVDSGLKPLRSPKVAHIANHTMDQRDAAIPCDVRLRDVLPS
jgi:hypothetical protein